MVKKENKYATQIIVGVCAALLGSAITYFITKIDNGLDKFEMVDIANELAKKNGFMTILVDEFSKDSRFSTIQASQGTKVFSCPDIMPEACHAASSCQSMCTGQLQINTDICVHRKQAGVAAYAKCTFVGYLVSQTNKPKH